MKKLEDAIKRFGNPDHGRTAKRLRDFENQLIESRNFEQEEIHGEHLVKLNGDFDQRDIKILQLRAEVKALQQLLNENDYEIDMLRNIQPVSTRDLWFTAGCVALVIAGWYWGFM